MKYLPVIFYQLVTSEGKEKRIRIVSTCDLYSSLSLSSVSISLFCILIFFFFQAEDGIRDYRVTGVQTCALPICTRLNSSHTIISYDWSSDVCLEFRRV